MSALRSGTSGSCTSARAWCADCPLRRGRSVFRLRGGFDDELGYNPLRAEMLDQGMSTGNCIVVTLIATNHIDDLDDDLAEYDEEEPSIITRCASQARVGEFEFLLIGPGAFRVRTGRNSGLRVAAP